MDQIFEMYRNINLGRNDTCLKCKKTAAGEELWPVAIWNVGLEFHNDPYKILFVGKTAVDDPGQVNEDGILDARSCAEEYFLKPESNIWRYLNTIVREMYGSPEEGWKHIAMSNLIKCNELRGPGAANDTTPETRKDYCLKDLGVFWRELEILKPRRVIFLTSWQYDGYIDKLYPTGDHCHYRDLHDRKHTILMGKKNIPWWHRRFFTGEKVCQEFLRTGHPERIQKNAFIENVLTWIKTDTEGVA